MSYNIIIAGINHNDPLCRDKIHHLLLNLKSDHAFVPDCIATEWDQTFAQIVIEQRSTFTKITKEKNLGFSDDTILALANTMAFEADSHMTLYPDLPILWIDKRFDGKIPRSISEYANDRLLVYRSFVEGLSEDEKNNLFQLSRIAWSRASIGEESERDEVLFRNMLNVIDTKFQNIFVIVGANHADENIKGGFASKLKNEGFKVSSVILC